MKPRTAAALAFFAATCLASTVVIAADIQENALHSPWLPDPDRTPGATNPVITQANIGDNICKKGWSTKSIRPPASYTTALKKKQLREWGYSDKNTRDFEEDHLESLEIGGSPTDPKNLWPQSYRGKWNAHLKDHLENRLHKLVCNGTLTLEQAQISISQNWIAAYKRYVLNMPEVASAP